MSNRPTPPPASNATGGFLSDTEEIDHIWQRSADLPSTLEGARLMYGEDVVPRRNPNH